MARLLSLAFITLLASNALADDVIRSVDISGPSRDQVKNEIVKELINKDDFRLTEETHFRLIFEQDAAHADNKPPYQTSDPINRYTFTIADIDRGVQVSADIQLVENVGSSFERRSTIKTGVARQAAQTILLSVKNSFAGASAAPPDATSSSPLEPARRRAVKPPASSRNPSISAPPRIGFAAAVSSDKEAQGFEITAVDPMTPAAKAGLRPSDIVMAIDGQPVATSEQMEAARAQLVKRRQGKMKVLRDGHTYDATLRFEVEPRHRP